MSEKKTIRFCNEPPALSEHIDPEDMQKIFGKIIPIQKPNKPNPPTEVACYYWYKAGVDCKRMLQAQNNSLQFKYESGEGSYIGHPFSWPLAKGLITDQNFIQNIEAKNAVGKWLYCNDCDPYKHYTIMIYYQKVTNQIVEDPYGETPQFVSCSSRTTPPDAPTYLDFVNSGTVNRCPNYYKVKPCIDCGGYWSSAGTNLNPNDEFYISLPPNQAIHPAYPYLRMPKWYNIYQYGRYIKKNADYDCYISSATGSTIMGKNYVPVDLTGKTYNVVDKSWNNSGTNIAGSMYPMSSCSDCLHEVIIAIEFCGEDCDTNDLINAYNGNVLVDPAAATRAADCLSKGHIRLTRHYPYPWLKQYLIRNNGKLYQSQAKGVGRTDCAKLVHISCPNRLVRLWTNYPYIDALGKTVFVNSTGSGFPYWSYIYKSSSSLPTAFYNDCCNCVSLGGTIGPKENCPQPPPPQPQPPPPILPPVGNPNNGGAPQGTPNKGPVYKILMLDSNGDTFHIWAFSLPGTASYRRTSGSIFTKWTGTWICTRKWNGRRYPNGQCIFEQTCAKFKLNQETDLLIYTKLANVGQLGTTPTTAYWDSGGPFHDTFNVCNSLGC